MINLDELEILKTVAQRLADSGISYIISGSIAANFYSKPRMTRDIDIVVQLSSHEIDKTYDLFKNDFYIDKDSIIEALKYNSMFNIIHNEKIIKVDLIIAKDTDYEKAKFQHKLTKHMEGVNLSLISPEDLILSKLLWAKDSHSEVQFNDVKNIISFNKGTLNFDYLIRWAKELSVEAFLEECSDGT